MATCKSCGARIQLVLTPAGKKLSLDAEPSAERGTVQVGGGYGVPLAGAELERARYERRALYVPHGVSCPQYWDWRRR